jgi:hypothetical protein
MMDRDGWINVNSCAADRLQMCIWSGKAAEADREKESAQLAKAMALTANHRSYLQGFDIPLTRGDFDDIAYCALDRAGLTTCQARCDREMETFHAFSFMSQGS